MGSDSISRNISSPRRVDLRLSALLVLGLTARLGWVLTLPSDPLTLQRLPDQIEYLELGRNLLAGTGLTFVDPRFADDVWAFRMPLYPMFVAICRGDIEVIRVVQALMDAGSILAVYGLARRWLGRNTSLIAAAIVAVNPYLVYFCGLILSETLFTAMLVWGMTLLVLRRPRDSRLHRLHAVCWWAGAGLLVLSILVRPSAILLPLVLGIGGAFVNRQTPQPYDRKWSPPVASLMLLLTLLALLPWAWRNKLITGTWVWTTTNGGFTLYDGLHPDATGASDQTFVRQMPQLQAMDEVGRSRYLSNQAWNFAQAQPAEVARLAVRKVARMWSPVPLSQEYGTNPNLLAVSLGYMIPFYILAIAGLWGGQADRSTKIYLLIPALYFTMLHAVSVGSLRYRVPADVPIAVVAAMGVAALISRKAIATRDVEIVESR